MALEKEVTRQGFTAKYWALNVQSFNWPARKTSVVLGLYKDAAAYAADPVGNHIMKTDPVFIEGDKFDAIFAAGNTMQQALYMMFDHIRTYVFVPGDEPEFADANIVE